MIFPSELTLLRKALQPHQLWLVGGASRAYIQKKPWPTDLDFCTTADPEETQKGLSNIGLKADIRALKFGCIMTQIDPFNVDITTLRQDAYTEGSRYPRVIFTNSLEQDSLRRDFTINALYLNEDGQILDFYNGVSDLNNGIVRFIGNPKERLLEDPLRLVRYIRFVAQYGVGGHTPELEEVLQEAQPLLREIPKKRLKRELEKIPALTEPLKGLASRVLGEYLSC